MDIAKQEFTSMIEPMARHHHTNPKPFTDNEILVSLRYWTTHFSKKHKVGIISEDESLQIWGELVEKNKIPSHAPLQMKAEKLTEEEVLRGQRTKRTRGKSRR